MKTPKATIFKVLFLLSFLSTSSFGQISLLSEDFNSCNYPTGWSLNIIGSGTPVYDIGMPTNINSDGSSIDGSCMLIIDDEATGDNTPSYVIQMISSVFDGTQTSTVNLEADVHFRSGGGSTLKIKVFDGTTFHEVRTWDDGDGTGQQFSEFEHVTLDLSFYASATMQLVIEYDDNESYGWWAGIDNIEVVGIENSTNIVVENFNSCSMPNGWSSQIQTGDDGWQFGLFNNGNSPSNSMNGSCFAYFDDNILGPDSAFSTVLLISPEFSGIEFANYNLDFDLIFRKNAPDDRFSVWVWEGNESHLVHTFTEGVAGPQIDSFEQVRINLSPYRSQTMRVVFSYEDGQDWGWWAGIDNVKISGYGEINDLCAHAVDLSTGSNCVNGNNFNALFDGTQPACSENNISGLWYRYVSDFTGILKIETNANFNDVITVYSGDCAAPTELTCTNRDEFGFLGESLYMNVSDGTEYLVRVSGVDKTFGLPHGHFCISVEEVPAYPNPPINDDCSSAIIVQIGSSCVEGNNLNANFNGPEPTLNLKSRADIWYVFQATTSEEIEVLTNADFADVITIYSGNCGALVEVATNEFGQSLKTEGLTVGQNYFIQIAGYFATLEGNICLSVEVVSPTIADNDLCANATMIIVDGGCVEGGNIAADFDGPNPSCTVFNDANIWYQFVAPASGGVKINTGTDFVHSVAIYSGDCLDLTEILCMDNPTRCDGFFDVNGLVAGDTFFMQIASALNPFGFLEGNLCVEILDINSTADFEPLTLIVEIECFDVGYGHLLITASGGVGDYTFLGNTELDTFSTGEEYLIVLMDENDCEVSSIGIFECGEIPCVLNTNLSSSDVSCFDEDNGEAFIDVLDGSAPYSYTWSNGANTSFVNGLSPGVYTVIVQDATGCPAELSVEITGPDLLLANISATGETDSNANDGTATASPTGGTEPLAYEWSNGAATQSLNNLTPGIYSVTVTDANGCESIESIVVSDFDCALSLDVIVQDISCNNVNDGYVEIYPIGGTAPFTYDWSNGATSDVVSNLGPGTYTVTVIDANDCPWIENVTLLEPSILSAVINEIIPVDCNGTNTGSASLTALGGTAPYTFEWPGGNVGDVQNTLAAGTYIVTLTDDHDCENTISVEIIEPEELVLTSINPQDVSCFGGADGIATVLISGGTSPYFYQWNDTNNQSTAQASNLPAGTYTVEVMDNNGCIGSTSVIINQPTQLVLSVDAVFDATDNLSNGSIQVTLNGGTAPYSYSWMSNGIEVSTVEDPSGLASGTYVLVVEDANGCELTSETIVIDNLVGLSDPELELYVDLMPNPTTGKFKLNIELQNTADVRIIITDVLGRVLVETVQDEMLEKVFDFNLSEYPSAVYPVKVIIGDKVVLKQVILQK
jgi:SprB-like repeat protein/type IX secretion system substrate protein